MSPLRHHRSRTRSSQAHLGVGDEQRGAPAEEERDEIEQAEAMLRALGLQGGEGSLLAQVNTLRTEGVAAYYDRDREEIVIPKSEPDSLAADATLVHELTHARQHQLGQLEDAGDPEDEAGRRALIEGEAEHIEDEWIDTLSEGERNDLEGEQDGQGDDAANDLDAVNPALVAMFAAPYTLGGAMVAAIDEDGRVADAFEAPARSSGDVFNPTRWVDPVESVRVDAPALDHDEEALGDDGPFGAYVVYMMLATALEPADALTAADGWAGDRMQVYRSVDDRTCVRVDIAGVDDAATTPLADAIDTWVASRPDGSASSTRQGDRIELDACDAGAAGDELTSERAMLPGARASLVTVLLDEGAPARVAACMGVEFVANFPFDLLSADELTEDRQDLVSSTWLDAAEACEE